MAYVRKTYGVPAKRGMAVEVWEWRRWEGRTCEWRRTTKGRVTSAPGPYLRIDGRGPWHPTWGVVYLSPEGEVLFDSRLHASTSAGMGGGEVPSASVLLQSEAAT